MRSSPSFHACDDGTAALVSGSILSSWALRRRPSQDRSVFAPESCVWKALAPVVDRVIASGYDRTA